MARKTTTEEDSVTPLDDGVFLCWNRDNITLEDFDQHEWEVAEIADGYTVEGQWSVSRRKNIEIGTHGFFLAQGTRYPRGIIGHGIVTSEPFEGKHWDDSSATVNYVRVLWDTLLPFYEPIPVGDLIQYVPSVNWKSGIPSSGFSVKQPAVNELLNLLREYNPIQEEPAPGEFEPGEYWEGAARTITVNRYERDPKARQACLAHHGYNCYTCDADLTKTYGDELGRRAIHVHHVIPMATRGKEYQLDPINDLVPLCPNCHNVIHKTDPVMTPDAFRKSLGT